MEIDKHQIESILIESWNIVKDEVDHELRPIIYKVLLDKNNYFEICNLEINKCIDRFTKGDNASAAGYAYSNSNFFRVKELNDILPKLLVYYKNDKLNYCNINIDEYIKEDSRRFFLNLQILSALLSLKERKNDDRKKTKAEPTLPEWTKSEKGKELLKKVISDGYVIKDTYKWDCSKRGRKALLAYFIDRASDYLDLRPENDKIPWLSFSFLMNNSGDIAYLKGVVTGYKHPEHPKPEPTGFREIKKMCQ